MTSYAKKIDGVWTVLAPGAMVRFARDGGEWFTSIEAIASWSQKEREAIGVYPVTEPEAAPEGKRIASTSLRDAGDRPVREAVIEDIPPPPVPQSVSNFQGRAMLRMNKLFDAVQSAIDAIEDPATRVIAQEAFERAPFNRQSPLLLGIAKALKKTDDEIDEMFRQGDRIAV